MGNWRAKANVNIHISEFEDRFPDGGEDQPSPEDLGELRGQILSTLRAAGLEPPQDFIDDSEMATDIEEFDAALTLLYDWADEERVWLGLGAEA